MPILRETTVLPSAIARRHTPRAGAYDTYRACLRWEFGFTCAFCRLHEADLEARGIARSAKTTIEHRVPRSDPENGARLRDVYANCYYACRFCNSARSTQPLVDEEGRRLLDPSVNAWSEHFFVVDHELKPLDRDAWYTEKVYDINDPSKVFLRQERESALRTAKTAAREIPLRLARLEQATRTSDDPGLFIEIELLQDLRRRVNVDLARYVTPPRDAPKRCRCGDAAVCTLTSDDEG